jgi:hypothetical protein
MNTRLGNRSALEWVIDQHQVWTDKRSGITNDPNRPDEPQYILRLVGQVITVSLETDKIVRSLPPLGLLNRVTTPFRASLANEWEHCAGRVAHPCVSCKGGDRCLHSPDFFLCSIIILRSTRLIRVW